MRKVILVLGILLAWAGTALGENNFDFRKSHWGDSLAQVQASEKGNGVFLKEKNKIGFAIKTNHKDGFVVYEFENNKLIGGIYGITVKDYHDFKSTFKEIKKALSSKYILKDTNLISDKNKNSDNYDLLKYLQENTAIFSSDRTIVLLNGLITELPSSIAVIYTQKEYYHDDYPFSLIQ